MTSPEDMPQPEESLPSEEPVSSQESFPEEPVLPEGFTPLHTHEPAPLPRARRRRSRRTFVPLPSSERAALLEDLTRRAFPSVEFFLFALLSGTVLGAAYLLNARVYVEALLLLGLLLAPILTPWLGLALATMTGSWRFFFQALASLLIAGLIIVFTGALAGLVGRLWEPLVLTEAVIHTQLWWPDLLVTVLGAALLVLSFVRLEQKPLLPNILLAYGFFLPLSAAGFGLGLSNTRLWSFGMQVFLVHLALATLVGGIILRILRFRPARASGYLLPLVIGFSSLIVLVFQMGIIPPTGLVELIRTQVTTTRYQPPTSTELPSATATFTYTPSETITLTATLTPTLTLTMTPTPSYAVINAAAWGGAKVRSEPGTGSEITVLINGIIVEVLPEIQSIDGYEWVHIRTANNIEGWVLKGVLSATSVTPTPVPANTKTP